MLSSTPPTVGHIYNVDGADYGPSTMTVKRVVIQLRASAAAAGNPTLTPSSGAFDNSVSLPAEGFLFFSIANSQHRR